MEQEQFGKVEKIELQVSGKRSEERETRASRTVEKIVIGAQEENQELAQEAVGSSVIRQTVLEETGRLRRKIALHYDLEETYVEIQIVEGEG